MRDLFQYALAPDHLVEAMRRNSVRVAERLHTRAVVKIASFVFLVALAAVAVEGLTNWDFDDPWDLVVPAMAALAIVAGLLLVTAQRQGLYLLVRKDSYAAGSWDLGVDPDGLWSRGPHGESFTRWSGWKSVEERGDLVLLCHDDIRCHPVPFAAFQSTEERREFIEHVRAKIAQHAGRAGDRSAALAPSPAPSSTPAPLADQAPRPRTLVSAALRIATFRPVREDEVGASWPQVIALVIATLLVPLAYALFTVGDEGYIAWTYLPAILFHVPVMLVAAIVAASLIGRADRVASILVASLLAWTVIDFFSLGLWLVLKDSFTGKQAVSMAFFYGPVLWLAFAVARFSLGLAPASGARTGWVLVALLLFLALPLGAIYRERSLWSTDYTRKAEASGGSRAWRAAAGEDAFYRQPELLRRELDALQPGRKGIVDVYFVGVAGYGSQDVFMREVDSVATLFREHFDADGHIVKLVNNPKTVLTAPVASATSLSAALKRVAEVMDADEDVLVLFLTSHGSADHQFSVQLRPLDFRQITPAMLREMLDASGIRNRVVIVSACYAGGFVNELKGDDTLVITAAAPDRNSFGCSNTNEWTYFGKAYFDEALRKTVSFTKAFEIAKPLIEEREKKEKFDPSNPQMSVGSAIKGKLEELERQLERKASPGRPAPGA